MEIVLAIDQGTTGSQAALFDASTLALISNAKVEHPQHYPSAGFVEHDLNQIWKSVQTAFEQAVAKSGLTPSTVQKSLLCVGVTNQRETVCAWDRASGEPLCRAIVWQDRRSADACERISKMSAERKYIEDTTGLVVDPYFSATKMQWLLTENAAVKACASAGQLALGTIDSFLMHRLSGGGQFISDHSNASRTMLYSLDKNCFDPSLCQFFGVPLHCLPELVPSSGALAACRGVSFLPDGLPITGCLGDQQASLFGHGVVTAGSGKITFGTGSFLLAAVDQRPAQLPHGLLCSVAFHDGKKARLCVEGSAFIAAAALQYLRDQFGWFSDSAESEALAASVERMPDLWVIPAFAGLGAPFWNPHARASILGLSLGTRKEHVIRATLEAIAFQNVALASLMSTAVGQPILNWGVDGGASNNNLLMQFQADVLQANLNRPAHSEITALGAAMAALATHGLATYGTVPPRLDPKSTTREFQPTFSAQEAQRLVSEWEKAAANINEFYSRPHAVERAS